MLNIEDAWYELTGVVNRLATNFTSQVRSIAKITKATSGKVSTLSIDLNST